jgi:hypothetical protein
MTKNHRDWSRLLALIGTLLLLVGLGALVLGPVEMYCFYLFSEGGPFHYEGFGFGSFMFGNIATQIMGYYVVAVLLIPLGYGHLRLRRWARPLALTYLYAWLVLGVPLVVVFLFILFSAKNLSLGAAMVAMIALALSYLGLPWLLIRFYQGQSVRLSFGTGDQRESWIERRPLGLLVLCFLLTFYAVVLHVPILFRGIFPFFGKFLLELEGIFALDAAILCLLFLLWGVLRSRWWAWWGSLVFVGLLAITTIVTFSQSSYAELLAMMRFPPVEMDALQGLPLEGYHFAILLGIPLLLTLGAILLARRDYRQSSSKTATASRGQSYVEQRERFRDHEASN